jgi:allophanate hydrolase subunit 1|tara:strand:+ start:670 stop:906 length:237 start_codon:yes stop_codon:yes gene_type:complete
VTFSVENKLTNIKSYLTSLIENVMLYVVLNSIVKYNLIFDDPLCKELSKEAELRGITVEELVEQILQEYVKIENGVII